MVTKATKPTKAKRSTPLGDQQCDLVLRDFRIVNLSCERFLAPEQAARGSYRLKFQIAGIKTPEDNKSGILVIKCDFQLEGHKTLGDDVTIDDKELQKSFLIKMSVEGLFQLSGSSKIEKNELQALIETALGNMHILSNEKLRLITADLGYRNVRPELGISKARIARFNLKVSDDNEVSME